MHLSVLLIIQCHLLTHFPFVQVIEAYNKLESYRPLRKPPLKRDRDIAWKALRERRKILKELEAFDSCSP